jgi:hypothetical protein
MSPDEIREKFNSITVWKRGGERVHAAETINHIEDDDEQPCTR